MAPLVVSVHSIVGLDFAGAATVFGALLWGFAMVLLLVVPLRRLLNLEDSSPDGTSISCAKCCW